MELIVSALAFVVLVLAIAKFRKNLKEFKEPEPIVSTRDAQDVAIKTDVPQSSAIVDFITDDTSSQKQFKNRSEMTRARSRDSSGRFIKDNPSTPENEAWKSGRRGRKKKTQ